MRKILFCVFALLGGSAMAETTFLTLPGAAGGNLLLPDRISISKEKRYITHFDVLFNANFNKCGEFAFCIVSDFMRLAVPRDLAVKSWRYEETEFRLLGESTTSIGGYSEPVAIVVGLWRGENQLFYISKNGALLGFSSAFTETPRLIYFSENSEGLKF